MHLLVDLQSCQSGSRLGGIGRYSLDLAKAMARRFSGDKFSILLNDRNPTAEFAVRREFQDVIAQSDIHVFPAPKNCRHVHDGGVLAADASVIRNAFIADLKPDVVHLSSLIEGLTDDVVTSIYPGSDWVNAVTVYDLIPLKQPDSYLRDEVVKAHYLNKVAQFANADVLLGISDFSTREILGHLGNFKGIAKNILCGIDKGFRPNPHARRQYAKRLHEIGINKPFLMYTASFDARKNQKGLVEALAKLPKKLRSRYQLVLVGNGWPAVYEELRVLAKSVGLLDDTLVFPGHVTDETLAALYGSCELFVFPSLWEGLGMPVLEAMASGAPCIGSNTTSVPEVLGLPAASFDPRDIDAMGRLIEKSLTDDKFRQRLKRHAKAQSSKFSWDKSAAIALDSFGAAMRKRPKRTQRAKFELTRPLTSDLADLDQLSIAEAKRQLLSDITRSSKSIKIGWLTTWEKRCGIATYSKNLLDHFPLDVTALSQNSYGGTTFELGRRIPTLRCWDEGKHGSLEQAKESVVKLGLTDLVVQFNYGLFNFEQLNALLVDLPAQGVNTHIVLHSTHDPLDEIGHRLLDIAEGLRTSANVFVHSDHDVERLAEIGVTQNVRLIPIGIRPIKIDSGKRGKGKRPEDPLKVGSYGFFLPHKGLLELIESVRVLLDSGANVNLNLVNACYGDSGGVSQGLIEEAQELVRRLQVGDHVAFHTDYVAEEESAALLAECDLIAFPYQETGESASAAIRMALALGKPILTTPLPIFDDVKSLGFQADGFTPSDLAAAIARVGADIKATNGRVQEVLHRVAKRVATHDCRGVSAHIARQIATYSLCARQVPKFTASRTNVSTRNATWTGDRWIPTEPGLMLYGPHIELEPGIYGITVDYISSVTLDGEAPSVAVTAELGNKKLCEFTLAQQSGARIRRSFQLQESAKAVEVLISSGESAATDILGYWIEQTEI